jgi:hypothetical protein
MQQCRLQIYAALPIYADSCLPMMILIASFSPTFFIMAIYPSFIVCMFSTNAVLLCRAVVTSIPLYTNNMATPEERAHTLMSRRAGADFDNISTQRE